MPLWLPPSNSTDTPVSRTTRIGRRGCLEARMLGDVEQLRQAGVLVAAQRRVDHVVGEDPRLLGLVADPAHGTLGQRAGLGDAQVDAPGVSVVARRLCYPRS